MARNAGGGVGAAQAGQHSGVGLRWDFRPAVTTAGGKNAQVRLQRVDKLGVTEIRTWGAHEKVSVKRA